MLFATIFTLVYTLLPGVIHTVQTLAGDKIDGATKKKMAEDALLGAATTAAGVLTGGNAQLAQAAAGAVLIGIETAGAIDTAVKNAKGTPAFAQATAQGNAMQAMLAKATAPAAQPASVHQVQKLAVVVDEPNTGSPAKEEPGVVNLGTVTDEPEVEALPAVSTGSAGAS